MQFYSGKKLQQRGRVTKFLMGLNEPYEQTMRNILMLKPIPEYKRSLKYGGSGWKTMSC